jgi:hypothetical protein
MTEYPATGASLKSLSDYSDAEIIAEYHKRIIKLGGEHTIKIVGDIPQSLMPLPPIYGTKPK